MIIVTLQQIAEVEMQAVLDRPKKKPAAEHTVVFGSEAACQAAGIDRNTLHNWLSRKPAVVLLSDDDRRDAGERKRFSFDRTRIVQIALTAELVKHGLAPRSAALAAMAFTDTPRGLFPDGRMAARGGGQLFRDATTVLVVPADPEATRVYAVSAETSLLQLFDPEYGTPFSAATIVVVDNVVARVDAVLNQKD